MQQARKKYERTNKVKIYFIPNRGKIDKLNNELSYENVRKSFHGDMNLNLNNNYNLNKEKPYNSYNQNIKPYPVSSSVNQNIQKEICNFTTVHS